MKAYKPLLGTENDEDVLLSYILDETNGTVNGPLIDRFFFNEAVINIEPEKKEIQLIFQKVFKENKEKTINELIPIISEKLKNYKIDFVYTYSDLPEYISTSNYNIDNDFIYLWLSNKIFDENKNFDIFIEQCVSFIGHELIHRYENIKINNIDLSKKILQKSKIDRKKYYGNKQELMSYAWQIINNFRTLGKNNVSIKALLKGNNDVKFKFGGEILLIYHKMFTLNDDELKLLYKYMYLYLEESVV